MEPPKERQENIPTITKVRLDRRRRKTSMFTRMRPRAGPEVSFFRSDSARNPHGQCLRLTTRAPLQLERSPPQSAERRLTLFRARI
ncbi:hypothetical protein EVAR_10552_1 [Eumeta japonica]|uniref:Uncharacterized protein n=1 Tax=Eumeta variegata TaxID=151549 RepID=A0A4C1ZGX1_EUMVA|nr:hypothetical protein EVAR_10552_1 [Eumeta japonica]